MGMEILLIPFFTVVMLDGALLVEHLKRWLYYRKYYTNVPYKPFRLYLVDCSMCSTFWLSLIFLISTGGTISLSALIGYVLLSTLNTYISILLRKWIN